MFVVRYYCDQIVFLVVIMGDILALWVSKVEFNEDNNFSKILIITSLRSKYNSVCPMKAFLFIKSQAAVGQSPQENDHHQWRGESPRLGS